MSGYTGHKRTAAKYLFTAFALAVLAISALTSFAFFYNHFAGLLPAGLLDAQISRIISGLVGMTLFDLACTIWLVAFLHHAETAEQRARLITFLEEEIPEGHFVYFYTGQQKRSSTFLSEEWARDSITLGKNLFSVLEAQGATKVRELSSGSKPYVFIFQKDRSALREVIAEDVSGVADVAYGVPQYLRRGTMRSTP